MMSYNTEWTEHSLLNSSFTAWAAQRLGSIKIYTNNSQIVLSPESNLLLWFCVGDSKVRVAVDSGSKTENDSIMPRRKESSTPTKIDNEHTSRFDHDLSSMEYVRRY